MFSVVKSSYRAQIRNLSALDDAAPVKKERFIQCYNKARLKGLSERVIRAGWRAAGLVPYNPGLVLNSSQVQTRPMTPPAPPQPIYIGNELLATPQRSQDLYRAQQTLAQSEQLSRSTRALLGKAGKAISAANYRAAELQAGNTRLQLQLDQLKIKLPRKRVKPRPNEDFADVEVIKAAMDQAAAKAAKKAAKTRTIAATRVATQSAYASLDSMCTQWQL
jgi:hypothetical protein